MTSIGHVEIRSGEFEDKRENRGDKLPGVSIGDKVESDFDSEMREARETLRTQQKIQEAEEECVDIVKRIADRRLGLKKEHSDRVVENMKQTLEEAEYLLPKKGGAPSGIGCFGSRRPRKTE
jgi:hypothetical protein